MEYFLLPTSSKVGKVVPKNAFDEFINTKQKKAFTDYIKRITWTHKLSQDTINLNANDIQEIQVFKVELKVKKDVSQTLEIINKFVPYHIIFWVEYDDEAYVSAASKHPHPTNSDISVIDWTFTSEWFLKENNTFNINLKENLDFVFKDICVQLIGKPYMASRSMEQIREVQQKIKTLKGEIAKLKSKMAKCQFNQKVELNMVLHEKQNELQSLESTLD